MLNYKKLIVSVFILVYCTSIVIFNSPLVSASLFEEDFETNTSQWTPTSGTWDWNTIDGSKRYGSTYATCCAESVAGNILWKNYIYEFELLGKQGVDKNAMFRYTASNSKYGIHLTTNDISLEKHIPGSSVNLTANSGNFVDNINYKIKIIANNNNYKIYVDDVLYIDYTDANSPLLEGKIGLRVGAGAVSPSQVWFDNVVVTEIMDATAAPTATASPTATPSATPTPTPTPTASSTPSPTPSPTATATATATSTASPTPIIPILSVPSLKQYSEPWQGNLYDHTVTTIKQWGCVLTSASMVLKYHGHDILPDALNTWLKSQSDGYIGNGLINWLAISRYTKNNDSPSSPTLEYKRLSATENNLDNELNNNRPAILKEEGHFVVATGKLFNGVYAINDPGYADRNDLTSYGNSFLAINSYSPTHSDLSYMMFVASSGITLELIDSNGNVIATSFTEDPINDISDPNNKSGEPLSILLFEKPNSANYKLRVKGSTGEYTLESYLYNVNGVVTQNSFSQTLLSDGTDTYDIVYTKENSETATNTVDVLATISGENGVSSTYGTATITWTTDKLSSSRVIYDTVSHDSLGSAPNYGYAFSTATYNESSKVTSHSVTITGLGSGTLYYYRVISEGSPVSISSEHTFRTLSKAGPPIANGTQNNNVQVLGSDIFKKYIIYQDVYYKDQEEEKKDEKKEVLGSKTETVKTIVKHLDKIDIFLISLASFLILIIIGIRLLPEPDKII
ncbi:MAG: fibronectin type III domain-containing protein [Patescibacteria group bacterium]